MQNYLIGSTVEALIGRDILIFKKRSQGKAEGTNDFIGVDFRKNKVAIYPASKISNTEKIQTLVFPYLVSKLNEG